jgi:hypothetical protein
MNYGKMKKAELIERIKELESEQKRVEDYDKLQNKYEVLKAARAEDKEKVEKAELIIQEYSQKEEQLTTYLQQRTALMKRDLDSQNETITDLFDMMDNTINLQIKYYQKYKNQFIKIEPKKEE